MVVGTVALAALEPLARAMDQLTAAIKEGYQFTGKAEKAITALGTSFEGGLKQMGPAVGKLRGTIEQQFTIGVMQLDAGLRGATTGVAKLINQQMLTGTAYKQTAEQFGRLQTIGGLQVESLNNLSDRTRQVGATYGISTDKLVKAIDVLKEQLVFFDVAGMGEGMTGAVVSLKGMLGATFDDARLARMMKLIAGTGIKDLKELTFAGIGDIRDKLAAVGTDADATLKVILDGIMKGGDTLLRATGKNWKGFGAIMGKLDPGAKDLIAAFKKLKSGVVTNADINMRFADNMQTMWSEVWNPIKKMMVNFQPQLNEMVKVITSFVQVISNSIAKWVTDIVPSGDVFQSFLTSVTDIGITISSWVIDTGLTLKNYSVHVLWPAITHIVVGLYNLGNSLKEFVESASTGFRNMLIGAGAIVLSPAIISALVPTAVASTLAGGALMAKTIGVAKALGVGTMAVGGWQAMTGFEGPTVLTGAAAKVKESLEKMGANFGNLEKAQDESKNVVESMAKRLRGVHDVISGEREILRQSGNSLYDIAHSAAEIDRKTTDPRELTSEYLHFTEEFLSRSIGDILALSIRDENDAILQLVNLTEEQNELLVSKGIIPVTHGAGPAKVK